MTEQHLLAIIATLVAFSLMALVSVTIIMAIAITDAAAHGTL